mmetsp:Transcript_26588/g.45808  ORF Transcript_26588/g.45808 Transcript_26588/m.45808 type:complete len:224 (-) Transcript_26588:915-1586(-)
MMPRVLRFRSCLLGRERGQGRVYDGQGLVDVGGGDDEGRYEAHDGGAGRDEEQAQLGGLADHVAGLDAAVGGELQAVDEAPATDLLEDGGVLLDELAKAGPELLAPGGDVGEDVVPLYGREDTHGRRTGKGIATEGAGVGAGGKDVAALLAGHHANWDAATEPLRRREHVRLNPDVLVPPQGPGSANPNLDLIEDQQRPGGVAQLPRLLEERLLAGPDAPLAL